MVHIIAASLQTPQTPPGTILPIHAKVRIRRHCDQQVRRAATVVDPIASRIASRAILVIVILNVATCGLHVAEERHITVKNQTQKYRA
jgi:hypothetical protein